MVFIEGILLLCLYSVFIYISYRKFETLFNPMAYIFANEILRGAIFLLIYPFDDSVFFPYVMSQVPDLDVAFFKYFIFQLIFSVIFFISFFTGVTNGKTLPIEFSLNPNYKKQKMAMITLLIIGTIMGIQYFTLTGGVVSYWENMNQRTILSAGTLFYRYYWLVLIAGLAMHYMLKRGQKINITSVLLTIFVFFSIVVFGGRSPVFFSIIFLIVVHIFLIADNKRRSKMNFKHVIRGLCILSTCVVILFLGVAFREPEAFYQLMNYGTADFFSNIVIPSSLKTLAYLNSVTKYIFLYGSGKFGYGEELWYGSSFLDLIYAVIPRSLFPDKPPVEEGIYIYSIINGLDVRPSTPASDMYPVAWPIDTIGVMYVNFGFLGIIPGAFIIGKVHSLFYNSVKKAPNLFLILIWVFQVFPFTLTNSGIFNFTIIFVFMWIIFTLFCGMKTKITKKRTYIVDGQ